MSGPATLKEIYIDEMRDLWSANDQMQRVMQDFSHAATNKRLKETLTQSISGIAKHTEMLKALIEHVHGKEAKDHCKGMEGLVAEAKKHALADDIKHDKARDILLIAQYQRMSHYGLAGFGTAAAYAKALGLTDDEMKLKAAVAEIHNADDYASQLAETSVNLAAKHG